MEFDIFGRSELTKDIWNGTFARGIKGEYETDRDYLAGQIMRSLPIVGGIIQAYDSTKYYSDYNKNRGLKWTDYKYGRGVSMNGAIGGALSVSSNIMSLYE